jgi:hypothetical protein
LGLSGVVLVFLPFVDYVPMEHFLDDLGFFTLIGPCVVLPFAISAGYLRWLLTGGLSRWEAAVGYALALTVIVLLCLTALQVWWEFDKFLGPVLLALGLGTGAWFVIQNLRHGSPPTLTALVAMQLAYLPFALGWLAAFPIPALIEGDWDIGIGAYLALLTVLAYTAQAVLSVYRPARLALRLLPLGLVWGGLAIIVLVLQRYPSL